MGHEAAGIVLRCGLGVTNLIPGAYPFPAMSPLLIERSKLKKKPNAS